MNHMRKLLRLGLCTVVAVVVILLAQQQTVHAQGTVLVFLPDAPDARSLQSELSSALGSVSVTVLGRVKDLKKQLDASPDATVLAPAPVLAHLGVDVALQGTRGGKTIEAMSLVRMEGTGDTIGILDLLGRKATPPFVSKLLGSTSAADLSVKRVRKNRDLRALLMLKQADAVIVPSADAAKLVKDLGGGASATPLDGTGVGLTSLGGAGASKLSQAFRGLSGPLLNRLGIDGWK